MSTQPLVCTSESIVVPEPDDLTESHGQAQALPSGKKFEKNFWESKHATRRGMVAQVVAPADSALVGQPGNGLFSDSKLDQLRNEMAQADQGKGIQAYIIPTEDPHMVLDIPRRPICCACCDACCAGAQASLQTFTLHVQCMPDHGNTALRSERLRTAAYSWCAWLQSEYAPASDERRHFISDFTGSAGTAVVTADTAALWTDGRYFLQVSTYSLFPSGCICSCMRELQVHGPIHAWMPL